MSSTSFWPLPKAWPMGFSWASYVAQETLLAILKRAGIGEELAICGTQPVPIDLGLVYALATDDAMLMSDAGPGAATPWVQSFEREAAAAGAILHEGKNVDDVLDGTCIGIDLVAGRWWVAPPATAAALLESAAALAAQPCASPAAVAGYLGSLQWLHLLRRPLLSGLGAAYDFARDALDWRRVDVPRRVVTELVVGAVLGLYWEVDMCRPFLPLLGATDASLEFGHGAALAELPVEDLLSISRLSDKKGEHVLLSGSELPVEAESRSRALGQRYRLGLALADFEVLFSIRVLDPGHINLEEERALIRYVHWVLRSPARFGHRIVVLIDSRVVLGGTTKGRSGSAALNKLLRQVAALTLAGGLLLHLVFVPSAHNPSDPPSRGGPATWPPALRVGSRYGVEGGVRAACRADRAACREHAARVRALAPLEAALERYRHAARILHHDLGSSSTTSSQSSSGLSRSCLFGA